MRCRNRVALLVALTSSLVIAAGSMSCGGATADARAQWVIEVSTDAPVPQLGDRLLVELVAPDGTTPCPGCRRLFGMSGPSAWPLSFGVPDPSGAELRLRVRLFRADHSDVGGAPTGALAIDAIGALPATAGGVRRVSVMLYAICTGVAADPIHSLTCDPQTGALVARPLDDTVKSALVPGSFTLAQATPCAHAPREGMACIEGGLFARGDSVRVIDEEITTQAIPERLVRLSPFALDRDELTVGVMRALVAAGRVERPRIRSGSSPACTYTEQAGELEEHPVNCITRDAAKRACAARGLRLPTEAEWEFAAGDRDRENRYPWGADPDPCRYAIVGRGRTDGEGALDPSSVCRAVPGAAPLAWGPRPERESDDTTALGLRHMGGNVSEWVADEVASYGGHCSDGPRVLVDPRCDVAEERGVLVRGGSWSAQPFFAETTHRGMYGDDIDSPFVGVRCAESL